MAIKKPGYLAGLKDLQIDENFEERDANTRDSSRPNPLGSFNVLLFCAVHNSLNADY
jgi:hypothetical protein